MSSEISGQEEHVISVEENMLKFPGKIPSLIMKLALGFQAAFVYLLSTLYDPMLLLPSLCLLPDDNIGSKIISLSLIFSGLATILHSLIGLRLPVISVPSRIYISSILLVLNKDWRCSPYVELYDMEPDLRKENFNVRFYEVRGAFLIVSFLQLIFILLGIPIFIKKCITKTTVASVMIAFAISNSQRSISYLNSGLSLLTLLLLGCFCLWKISKPLQSLNCAGKYPLQLLKLFPVVAVLIGWFICKMSHGTELDESIERYLKESVNSSQNNVSVLDMFGWPTLSWGTFLYIAPSMLLQNFLSISSFLMIGHIVGKELKSKQVTRALYVECFSGIFASLFGIPALVSTDLCIAGLISLTNVKSKMITMFAGIWLIVFALIINIFLPLIPPLQSLYAFNLIIQGMIMATGFAMIDTSDECSSTIVGVSVAVGLVVPKWILNAESWAPIIYDSSVWITAFWSFILVLAMRK